MTGITVRRGVAGIALVAIGLLGSGCYANNAWPMPGGQYRIDLFPEMHYSQAFRSQEPRRMYPPEGAVPVTGAEVVPDPSTASRLANPIPRTRDAALADELYRINCTVCHGDKGDGAGRGAAFLTANNGKAPTNLTLAQTKNRTDGDLWYILTRGLNYDPMSTMNGMPPWGNLLTGEERWLLVNKIRRLQGS